MSQSTPSAETEPAEDLPVDKSAAHIGIVCTHAGEIRPLLKRLDRVRRYTDHGSVFRGGFLNETTRVAVVEAKSGFARHRQATEILICEHRPAWVLAIGFSSGLVDALKPGDLTLATEICDTHGNSLPVACKVPASQRVHIGRHVVSDHHPLLGEQKVQLAESSGSIAVDTASLAAAQVCQQTGTRFLSIRAIIDAVNEQIPEQAAPMIFEPTSRALGSALATLLQGVKRAKEMHSWRERSLAAASHLDRFATGIILQLAEKL